MPKIAALFSGQGSQYPAMGKDLYDNFPKIVEIYSCASDIFGFDVAAASFNPSPEQQSQTDIAQPIIFTHSMACFTAASEILGPVQAVAGHSLGEFAALCVAGAYSLEDGMRIISRRCKAMKKACEQECGTMYAIIGCPADEIKAVCQSVEGFVYAVNFNMPNQTVISGEIDAAKKAASILSESGAKTIQLQVESAFHTTMMHSAADSLKQNLSDIVFKQTTIDFYSNLTGAKFEIKDYPEYFAQHMLSPVLFVDQIQAMAGSGITHFIEFGPKKTLATFAKKIDKNLSCANVEDMQTLEKLKQWCSK